MLPAVPAGFRMGEPCTKAEAEGVWGIVGEQGTRQEFLAWNLGREGVGEECVWMRLNLTGKKMYLFFH